MAIVGVSSGGYNTVYATNPDKKDTPTAEFLTKCNVPNLTGVSLRGTALTETIFKYDRFEQGEKPFVAHEKLVHTPIERNIGADMMTARNEHIRSTIEKSASMNLSYGESALFFKQEGRNWVEDIRQKDPEMFVEWVKSNKKFIEDGKPHLANLPSNFTMKDYYSYVKDE